MTDGFESFLRIPVRFKNGAWVTDTGRKLTAEEGTAAEFFLPAEARPMMWPQREVHSRKLFQFLAPDASLMFALRVRQRDLLTGALLKHLIPPHAMRGKVEWGAVKGWQSTEAHFVKITLGASTENQKEKAPSFSGGLLVAVQGRSVKVVDASPLKLPVGISETKPLSLNHALTILSEVYEVHRVSHTGSIYETVFYKGGNDRWYPLGHLRELGAVGAEDGVERYEAMADLFPSSAED